MSVAESEPIQSRTSIDAWALVALVLSALLIASLRLHTLHQPLEWDLSTYILFAQRMRDGWNLYSDLWDIKPPGIFAVHVLAQSMMGDSLWTIYVLGTCVAITTMALIYYVAGKGIAGLVAAAGFAILSSDLAMEANRPNTEAYINLLLAFGLAMQARNGGKSFSLIASIAFALATIFKQVAILPAILISLIQKRWREVGITLVACAVVWGGLFGYFAATNRGLIAWQTFVLAPIEYGQDRTWSAAIRDLSQSPARVSLLPCIVLSLLAMALEAPKRRLLAAMLLGSLAAMLAPRQIWGHSFQLLLIPLTLGTGWGISAVVRTVSRRVAAAVAGTTLLGLAILQWPAFRMNPSQWSERQYGGMYTILDDCIVPVQATLKPHETLLVWGDDPWIYHRVGRKLPCGMIFRSHLTSPIVGSQLAVKVLEQVQRNPPDLLLVRGGSEGPENLPVWHWLMEHYRPMGYDSKNYPMLTRYVRIGSDLDRRTAE